MDPLQRYLSSMGYPYRHVTLPSSSSSSKGLAKSSSNNSLSASNQTHNLSNSTLTPAAERLPHQMEKSSSTIDVNGLNMSELDKLKNESGSFPRVYARLFFDRMIPKQHKAYAVKTELGDFCFALRIADDKCLIVVFSEDETTSFELSYSSYSIPLFTTLDSLINSYFHIILHCYLKTLSQSSSAINKSPSFPTSLSACLSQSNLNLSDLLTSPDNCKGLIKGPVTELKQMNDYFGKFKYLEKPIETGMVKVDVAIEDGSDVPAISYKVFLSSLGTKIRGELLRKSGSAEEMSMYRHSLFIQSIVMHRLL
ncbi:hypothetical protein BKA69DRAFT_763943 [Paraphysoderma sedebokerense]|nr:hypothetical protein BKA69DRAFT_763943 [Paraphysoderma sedebokerense]